MSNIWIGDFRCKALQSLSAISDSTNIEQFITDDFATYRWFEAAGLQELRQLAPVDANVIIMLGLMDCINSCTWSFFNIDTIAAEYVKSINTLIDTYNCAFYICAVNPVDDDYSYSSAACGIIPKKALNEKITAFNEYVKKHSNAVFIDSYDYLTSTHFDTYDGVHYTIGTLGNIFNFIANSIGLSTNVTFAPRLTAPKLNDQDADNPIFWQTESAGGCSPFEATSEEAGSKYEGDTLPNCHAYVWGRYYEILGSAPALSVDVTEGWYNSTVDGYSRGQKPALGAIVCWQKDAAEGESAVTEYVAVVEQIHSDGSIVTSESGWDTSGYWRTTTRENGADENWGQSSEYIFQGFIYCPAVVPNPTAISVDKSQVTSHTGATTQAEREINAMYIYKYLGSRGWTLNAVAGLLGNLEHESWINPGVTEIGGTGFGLVQWTPPSKFTNWCDAQNPPLPHDDVDSQLARIEHERDPSDPSKGSCTKTGSCSHNQYFYRTNDSYGDKYAITYTPKTLKDFAISTKSPFELACAFLYNYECPGSICWGASSYEAGKTKTVAQREETRAATREKRGKAAQKWYEFLAPFAVFALNTPQMFKATNLTVDSLTPTSVQASFLVCLGNGGYYSIFNSADMLIDTGSLNIGSSHGDASLNIISFTSNALVPNEEYKLVVTVTNEDDTEATLETSFATPQSLPKTVEQVRITATETKLPCNVFQLSSGLAASDWGYWKRNGCGYTIRLILNGKNKAEKEVTTLPKTFKVNEFFEHSVKAGDTIQIGIRTWVLYKGGKLYDSDFVKCSNSICMLANQATAYIHHK